MANAPLINKVLSKPAVTLGTWASDFAALFMPRLCSACDTGLMRFEESLCLECLRDLPRARFHDDPDNRVEQLFHGKVMLHAASSFLLFSRTGKVQRMLHRLKYAQDRNVGLELGRLMAEELMASERFRDVDTLLPVPLHPRKEHMRGYNQSQVLVEGMRKAWPLPSAARELVRVVRTPSQTRKGRLDRWRNVSEAFQLGDTGSLRDKHVLIVDDVVTTGSTIESCARVLAPVPGLRISVCTVACA